MFVQVYLEKVRSKYATGDATEHSYRSALEGLFENTDPDLAALNEPKRVACGAPDFIIQRKGIPVGHCEAKDLHIDLTTLKADNLAQKKRYLKALPNLIYTNGLDFEFYKSGEIVRKISIGVLAGGKIEALPDHFETLANQLAAFAAEKPQSITSAKKLAEMMAGKAVLIKDIMSKALKEDAMLSTELTGQYQAFKAHLIHDIDPDEFADIYAETIAYGMFAARLHDPTPNTFSRMEALELLPKSNPFLRSLFGYIAGVDLDDRIKWVIDELADVFQACDLHTLLQDFGKFTARNDPFLHFYETFLAEYNPAKRKARGVWYTPEPVVNFIVRAVDDVLKTEFGLPLGLADTSKITIPWETGQTDAKGNRQTIKKQVHRVQILDPATGTGTFLAEVIKQIAAQVKGVAEGMWSNYVEQDLIPRLHGFELLMASYAMCHMKLDMMLTEMGYKPTATPPRLGVYLTNSLEEGEAVTQNLFAQWLANEAKSASEIKRQMPIMCVIGNPPYSIKSSNLTEQQVRLIDKYRYSDGVKIKEKGMLQFEININNDYIKFISLAESLINKNGFGVVAMITSHGYLRPSSFRGMREHLIKTFKKIYVIDLHGNSEIKEVTPEDIIDKNVFDIKQGVSIIIGIKNNYSDESESFLKYCDIWGSRDYKNTFLFDKSISEINWIDFKPESPNYTFDPKIAISADSEVGTFNLSKFMNIYSSGVITARDDFSISENIDDLIHNAVEFSGNANLSDAELCAKLSISMKKGWDVSKARHRLRGIKDLSSVIQKISYRPFDNKYIIFDDSVVWTTAKSTMNHMLNGDNIALITARSEKSGTCSHFFTSKFLVETKCGERTTQSAVFPLYLYPESGSFETERRVNFDPKIYAKICLTAGLSGTQSTSQPASVDALPDEVKVFDYIYGVLHSPDYRRTYAQFLKIDFPRIPYPTSPEMFAHLADKGGQLRRLHLMEDAAVGATPYPFKGEGAGEVVKPEYTDEGKVFINPQQWFEGVPRTAWEFHIGGYQPAQKWLKDRKGRTLSFDDVRHYQKIIKILCETSKIMNEIDITSLI